METLLVFPRQPFLNSFIQQRYFGIARFRILGASFSKVQVFGVVRLCRQGTRCQSAERSQFMQREKRLLLGCLNLTM